MKWKAVAKIIAPQNHDPKDLLNRSFSVSLVIPTTPVVTWSPARRLLGSRLRRDTYIDGVKDGKVAKLFDEGWRAQLEDAGPAPKGSCA